MCTARQDHQCDLPYLSTDDVEAAVMDHYATLRLPNNFAVRVRSIMDATLTDDDNGVRLLRSNLTAALAALERKEENLLDFIADGDLPAGKVRARLAEIAVQRERVQAELRDTRPSLEAGAAVIGASIDLLDHPQELYRLTTNKVRRQLNQDLL